jgi:hypothetical protein
MIFLVACRPPRFPGVSLSGSEFCPEYRSVSTSETPYLQMEDHMATSLSQSQSTLMAWSQWGSGPKIDPLRVL